ncbi:MAG: peptidoglycan-binding protein [Alphaproteobacteria bacterium]|nr:peptidoglycan-binding protein [Alphaproteobacteria bacterium]
MRNLIRNLVLGTASVLALGAGGATLSYSSNVGNRANAASIPAAWQTTRTGDNLGTKDSRWAQAQLRKDDIRWAQAELRYRGLYNGSLDGVLGPETKHALQQFQQKNGLLQTASLDAQTWEVLTGNANLAAGSSAPPDTERGGPTTKPSKESDLGK